MGDAWLNPTSAKGGCFISMILWCNAASSVAFVLRVLSSTLVLHLWPQSFGHNASAGVNSSGAEYAAIWAQALQGWIGNRGLA